MNRPATPNDALYARLSQHITGVCVIGGAGFVVNGSWLYFNGGVVAATALVTLMVLLDHYAPTPPTGPAQPARRLTVMNRSVAAAALVSLLVSFFSLNLGAALLCLSFLAAAATFVASNVLPWEGQDPPAPAPVRPAPRPIPPLPARERHAVAAAQARLEWHLAQHEALGDTRGAYEARTALAETLPDTVHAYLLLPAARRRPRELTRVLTDLTRISEPDQAHAAQPWQAQVRFIAAKTPAAPGDLDLPGT